LGKFALNGRDQGVSLAIHLILGLEEGSALFVARAFKASDAFLSGELCLQGERGRCLATSLFDRAV